MEEVFKEVVTHVSLKYKKGENKIRIYSSERMKDFDDQPLFFIDGISTFNKSFVLNLAPSDIESVKVFRSSRNIRQFGFLGKNGVVALSTKSKTLSPTSIPNNNVIEFQGFHNPREFYVPKYAVPVKIDKSKPDLRSLIYWNPMITTDIHGKASLLFYNTDNITTIDSKIEGMSLEGIPGVANHKYKILPLLTGALND